MFTSLTRRVLEPPAFGLDISDLTAKYGAIARRGKALELTAYGEFPLPPGIVVDGEIKNEDELSRVISQGLGRAPRPVRERTCVASLPEEKSFVKVIELPRLKPEDVPPAVRWEIEGVVPLPPEEIVYDHEVTPLASREHTDVLITAFPKAIVESYHRVLRSSGLTPLALELESQAISRSLMGAEAIGRPAIIIDLGAARTSFIIFAGGSMLFTKSIAVGGRDFESAIAQALGVPPAEARGIKVSVGLSRHYHQGRVFEALRPHLEAISQELERQLWFYRDHPAKRHAELGDIEAVILCGGDANLTGLPQYLATAIKRPVILGDPFSRFGFSPGAVPPISKNESLKYTTTIGLALRAAGL